MSGLAIGTGLSYGTSLQSQKRIGGAGLDLPASNTAPATPTALALSPASPEIADTASIGSRVATIVVTMSDGAAFGGTLVLTDDDSGNFGLDGAEVLVFAEPLSDGDHSITAQATQNGVAFSHALTITVTADLTRITQDGATRVTMAGDPRIVQ